MFVYISVSVVCGFANRWRRYSTLTRDRVHERRSYLCARKRKGMCWISIRIKKREGKSFPVLDRSGRANAGRATPDRRSDVSTAPAHESGLSAGLSKLRVDPRPISSADQRPSKSSSMGNHFPQRVCRLERRKESGWEMLTRKAHSRVIDF